MSDYIFDNFKAAKTQVSRRNSCLKLVSKIQHFSIPPSAKSKLTKFLKYVLSSKIKSYDQVLGGTPVAYSNQLKPVDKFVKLRHAGNHGKLDAEYHCQFVVFSPKIKDTLVGVVSNHSHKAFGCLVHGYFYIVVQYLTTTYGERIYPKIGAEIELKVTRLEEGSGNLSIHASCEQYEEGEANFEKNKKQNFNDSGVEDFTEPKKNPTVTFAEEVEHQEADIFGVHNKKKETPKFQEADIFGVHNKKECLINRFLNESSENIEEAETTTENQNAVNEDLSQLRDDTEDTQQVGETPKKKKKKKRKHKEVDEEIARLEREQEEMKMKLMEKGLVIPKDEEEVEKKKKKDKKKRKRVDEGGDEPCKKKKRKKN